jgi:RNA polymerase sigma-70 factor (ECF subfamily)
MDARAEAEKAARMAYGRLVAYLAARTRDIAAAEEALAAAFLRALEVWPQRGVPDRPEAWLLVIARNRLKDSYRRNKVRTDAEPTLTLLMQDVENPATPFPDERLKLMFVCTHPAIDETIRTPLMLQTVLGLSAERIASSFLVKPAAMGQRLSRAKAKIRDAGIAFEVPEADEFAARLPPLLNAIYAAFGLGWADFAGGEGRGLSDEALDLGLALHGMIALTPELNGLVALMLYCQARKAAHYVAGRYVRLGDQDFAQWDWSRIEAANRMLNAAGTKRAPGRFQLEALIQSVHVRSAVAGGSEWAGIIDLYEALLKIAPSLAARTNYAVALTEAGRAADGLAVLDGLDTMRMNDYQPWWVARGHVLKTLGRLDEARLSYERAIGLSQHEAQRDFLRERLAEI